MEATFPTIEFKAQLILHRIKFKDIAEAFGVRRPYVSQVIGNFLHDSPIKPRLIRMYWDMKDGKFTRLEDY